jgi:CYTH domain-containing protein
VNLCSIIDKTLSANVGQTMTVKKVQKLEIERKWLCLKTPSSTWLSSLAISIEEITQWYDQSGARLRRIQKKDQGLSWVYTEKSQVKYGVRIEDEVDCADLISEGVFYPIKELAKTRFYLELNKRIWSADLVYVKGKVVCIVEVELESEEELLSLKSCDPVFGEVMEITDNMEWSSEKLAAKT